MPRYNDGQPLDHSVTRRRVYLASFLDKLPEWMAERLTSWIIDGQVRKMWPPLKEEWHLLPAPPIEHSPGVINDDLIGHLTDQTIISVSGVDAFTSSGIIVNTEQIEVDTVIFCTGTYFDYSFLDPEADPTRHPTPGWDTAPYQNGLAYPWLYQTLFSINFPESLAFIGPCSGFAFSAFLSADLAAQAIAQIWKGFHPLPSKPEMDKWCENNYARSVRSVHRWRVPEPSADPLQLERWLNDVVGNGMNESLGWGWVGWTFWWKEREMYRLIMDGVNTPFVYRLFEGKREGGRKKWDGARDAIRWANGLARNASLK